MAAPVSERAVYIGQDQQEPSAIPSTTEYEYALPPMHILVPLDCQGHTRHVFDYALALAGKLQARLILLHILEMPAAERTEGYVSVSVTDYLRQHEVEMRRVLDTYAHQARDAGLRCDVTLDHGVPFQQVLNYARDQEADLILMGTQGRTGLPHMVLGSVAEKVVRLAPCPVLAVHGKA
jgi:nucleotide-binding universal stress UspA family protein